MSALLANPALLVGLIRAVLILLVTFGVAVTQAQQHRGRGLAREALHRLRRGHEPIDWTLRRASAPVGHRCQPSHSRGSAMGPPVQADDRPPRRPARLRVPGRWSRASGAPNARPDARPRPGAHRRWRAVRPRQHPRAVPLEELGQRSAPRERTKGRPGVPTRGFCAPGRPRLPIVCTRPSFANNPGRRSGTHPGWPTGATGRRSGAVTMAVANHATECGRAPGSRPGPDGRLAGAGLSRVALGAGRRHGGLAAALGPRPDRLGRRDGLRLGRVRSA